jgi:hypothetical protein
MTVNVFQYSKRRRYFFFQILSLRFYYSKVYRVIFYSYKKLIHLSSTRRLHHPHAFFHFSFPYFPNPPSQVPSPPNPTHQPTRRRTEKKNRVEATFAAMAGDPPTAAEKETLVSSFIEITAGQTLETATQFLQVRFPLSSPQNHPYSIQSGLM